MRNIAIITARGGSRRIPGKNIKDFFDKPIIYYPINALLQSGVFDEIMVSTDNEEIAEVAKQFGAKVPFMRSEKNSDDFATTSDVLLEVLQEYTKRGDSFDNCCCIYPANPFTTKDILFNAYNILINDELCNTVMPLVKYGNPIERSLRLGNDDFIEPANPAMFNKRSQDLEDRYYDPGQFYFFRVNNFLQTGKILDKTRHIEISEMQAQDIDNLQDWKMAEIKFNIDNI